MPVFPSARCFLHLCAAPPGGIDCAQGCLLWALAQTNKKTVFILGGVGGRYKKAFNAGLELIELTRVQFIHLGGGDNVIIIGKTLVLRRICNVC
uniref:Uncharacterized protein n=1 Tax=Anguilla anguilla TaxID=7936 RepID=A0A0E9PX99_ANGAN